MRCPVCKADNSQGPTCRRCKADLSLLFRLDEQRALLLQRAAEQIRQGHVEEARADARQAHQLRRDTDSGKLLAVIELLRGDYSAARRWYQDLREARALP
jgi:hypothetical protein